MLRPAAILLSVLPAYSAVCCSSHTAPNPSQLTITAIHSAIRTNGRAYKTVVQIAPEFPASPIIVTGTSCTSRGPSANIWDCTGIVSADVFSLTFNLQRKANNTLDTGAASYKILAFNEECVQKSTCPDTIEAMGVDTGTEQGDGLIDLGPLGRRPVFVVVIIAVAVVLVLLAVAFLIWRRRRGNPVKSNDRRREDGFEKDDPQLFVGWARRPEADHRPKPTNESARGLIMDAMSKNSQSEGEAESVEHARRPRTEQERLDRQERGRSKSFDWSRIPKNQPSTSRHKRQQSDGQRANKSPVDKWAEEPQGIPMVPLVPQEPVKSRSHAAKPLPEPLDARSGSVKVKTTGVGLRSRSVKEAAEAQPVRRMPSGKSDALVTFTKEEEQTLPKAPSIKKKQSHKAIPKTAQVIIRRPSRKSVKSAKSKKSRPSSPTDPKMRHKESQKEGKSQTAPPSASGSSEDEPLAMYSGTNEQAREIQDAILKWNAGVLASAREPVTSPPSPLKVGSVLTDLDDSFPDTEPRGSYASGEQWRPASSHRQSLLLLDEYEEAGGQESEDDKPLSVLSHGSLHRTRHKASPPPLPKPSKPSHAHNRQPSLPTLFQPKGTPR